MTEHRVLFDFEIDFSNGGGIQGQGFRLDIEGDSIGDDDLAALIARDLRLLMVRETRILHKSIIKEAHKREKPPVFERERDQTQSIGKLSAPFLPSSEPSPMSKDDWIEALRTFLAEEKTLTRAQDRLAAARRRLPRHQVEDHYLFETPQGPARLSDLFDGRDQLIVYHHMLRPADPDPCSGCSMFADSVPHLAHLHARNTSLVMVSRAPLAEIEAFSARMGWTMPWVETRDGFNADFGVNNGFGLNVFLREGCTIWRTYFTSSRGVEALGSVWSFLDLTPYGRQETWQNAPEGTPQEAPYQWWRLHDQYGEANGGCCGN
jgi:predicted dithiol-disulfide oxidoreductase (DUF899 family)